jgi:aminoglycoside phosphotransferase (APT) family kinase protein
LDPVLLVYQLVPGSPITYEAISQFGPNKKRRLASSLALVLAALHSPATRRVITSSRIELPSPTPQADTSAIRARLCPTLDSRDAVRVLGWCDWVDSVQAEATADVVLHGDFHGYNLIIDESAEVRAVLDLEEMSLGDLHYDFRYLPAQESSIELFRLVATAYEGLTGTRLEIQRVMAWHIRTVLGDALWRGEAKVPLPGGGTVEHWIEHLAAKLAALDIL